MERTARVPDWTNVQMRSAKDLQDSCRYGNLLKFPATCLRGDGSRLGPVDFQRSDDGFYACGVRMSTAGYSNDRTERQTFHPSYLSRLAVYDMGVASNRHLVTPESRFPNNYQNGGWNAILKSHDVAPEHPHDTSNHNVTIHPFPFLQPSGYAQSTQLPPTSFAPSTITLRKRRRPYTKQQITELEREYLTTSYISKTRRWELSQRIALTERQIKIWFQNRRIKEKKSQSRSHFIEQNPQDSV